jgi:hypothetical protein
MWFPELASEQVTEGAGLVLFSSCNVVKGGGIQGAGPVPFPPTPHVPSRQMQLLASPHI